MCIVKIKQNLPPLGFHRKTRSGLFGANIGQTIDKAITVVIRKQNWKCFKNKFKEIDGQSY